MAAVALLETKSTPSDKDINAAMKNICRCGTYTKIRKAIHKVALERASQ
jgi:isoquinoline 1-oxidoreductase alpha subunit